MCNGTQAKTNLILALLFSLPLWAQTTPHLGLKVPAYDSPNWNASANQNFTMLDNFLSGAVSLPALKTSNRGIFTNTFTSYISSLVNGILPTTENGTMGAVGVTGGVAIPAGARSITNSGVAGFCNTSASSISRNGANCVGGYFEGRALANNSAVWGINPLVQDVAGISGHNMTGVELDINLYGSPMFFKGYYLTGLNGGGALPRTATGFEISLPYQLPIGFICDRASCAVGAQFYDSSSSNPSASQSIQFISHNSGGLAFIGTIDQDANGNILLGPATGSSVISSAPIQTNTVNQVSANRHAGVSACVSSTKTITLPITYSSQPVILVFDETTAGGVKLTAKSTSGFTVSCAGSTDAFDWIVVGNPN